MASPDQQRASVLFTSDVGADPEQLDRINEAMQSRYLPYIFASRILERREDVVRVLPSVVSTDGSPDYILSLLEFPIDTPVSLLSYVEGIREEMEELFDRER